MLTKAKITLRHAKKHRLWLLNSARFSVLFHPNLSPAPHTFADKYDYDYECSGIVIRIPNAASVHSEWPQQNCPLWSTMSELQYNTIQYNIIQYNTIQYNKLYFQSVSINIVRKKNKSHHDYHDDSEGVMFSLEVNVFVCTGVMWNIA